MDLNFEQMLAQHNQNYKESEVYSDWMPDDGEYIVSLIKLTHDTASKNGEDFLWWRLTGRIEDVQDEKLNSREFSVGYYTSKVFGILKGAINVLAGREINDLAEAHAILEASIGLVARVRVRTSRSRKDGKDYTNCFILEVIDTTTSAGDNPETVAPGEEMPSTEVTGVGGIPAEAPIQ